MVGNTPAGGAARLFAKALTRRTRRNSKNTKEHSEITGRYLTGVQLNNNLYKGDEPQAMFRPLRVLAVFFVPFVLKLLP